MVWLASHKVCYYLQHLDARVNLNMRPNQVLTFMAIMSPRGGMGAFNASCQSARPRNGFSDMKVNK